MRSASPRRAAAPPRSRGAVATLNVSHLPYADRLTAACLQGLANRHTPRLFLNFGIYDDPGARRTNEVFLPDAIWHEKYRAAVGNQDVHNLAYYRKRFGLRPSTLRDLRAAVRASRDLLHGLVVWDPQMPDTANIAIMLAAQEDLLVVAPDRIAWAERAFGLEVRHDLRGRWRDRLELYAWAFENLQPRCKAGTLACVEPAWQRPEFADYLVANRIFTYSLSSAAKGVLFRAGQTLLLLLVGGPFSLRNLIFDLHLERAVKRFGLALIALGSPETRLALRIQHAARTSSQAILFGWHTARDDELAFMLLLSASDLRLVPAHLAGNFSFHSQLPGPARFEQAHVDPATVALEEKTYLTFTLSDGDQLVLMSTAELGNWRREERGHVPFNWEVQPLLVDLAPALLGQYYETRRASDYLIGGPSGAGYIIPPLHTQREAYLAETARACRVADLRVFTPYLGDPPRRLVGEYGRMPGDFIGFIGGYAHFGRTPTYAHGTRTFLSYRVPFFQNIWDSSEQVLQAVRRELEAPGRRPRFIAVHLFAYRTTLHDVHAFVRSLDPRTVKVVRADEFLIAAGKYLEPQGDPR